MIALEYAKAILDLAKENNSFEEISNEFDIFWNACEKNKDIYKVLLAPNISQVEKKEVITRITTKMNVVLRNFLYVLIDNQRFSLLPDIHYQFNNMVMAMDNIMTINVYAATKLDKSKLELIEEKMKMVYHCRKVFINSFIDEALIGGIKIIFNGKSLDLSLEDRLSKLKNAL